MLNKTVAVKRLLMPINAGCRIQPGPPDYRISAASCECLLGQNGVRRSDHVRPGRHSFATGQTDTS
jgi:hypothetical protein